MISFAFKDAVIFLILPWIIRRFAPIFRQNDENSLRTPLLEDFQAIEQTVGKKLTSDGAGNWRSGSFWRLFIIWTLLVLSAMRPIASGDPIRLKNEGRDILLVTDISTSMQESDFAFQGKRLTRLSAVKAVVSDFVEKRTSDRIGLILFGTRAYLQVPLTYDRQTLKEVLLSTSAGMAGDSTSIGDALGLAVKAFRDSGGKAESKTIILLTDGENNDGALSPAQALALAQKENIKIYTISVGLGRASLLGAFFGRQPTGADNQALRELAEQTGGRYFQASDLNALVQVYRAIDALEPETIEQNIIRPTRELFYVPLLIALLLAFLSAFHLRRTAR